MNVQRVSDFFDKLSRDPALQREFVALAARHGIDLGDDQLSEADLAGVSGGTDATDSLAEMGAAESLRLQTTMDRMSVSAATLSNLLKKQSDTANSIVSNLK